MEDRQAVLARTADVLTLGRAGLAPVLGGSVAAGHPALAAWLLAAAWASDALDGRLARASPGGTRLGGLDLVADTVVGASLLLGLGLGGVVPAALSIGLVVALGGGFLLLRNPVPALVLQGVAYGRFLALLWVEEPVARWVPLGVAAAALVAGFQRFTGTILPAFFGGLPDLVRLRRGRDLALPGRRTPRH